LGREWQNQDDEVEKVWILLEGNLMFDASLCPVVCALMVLELKKWDFVLGEMVYSISYEKESLEEYVDVLRSFVAQSSDVTIVMLVGLKLVELQRKQLVC
jgi:hypothetical protein